MVTINKKERRPPLAWSTKLNLCALLVNVAFFTVTYAVYQRTTFASPSAQTPNNSDCPPQQQQPQQHYASISSRESNNNNNNVVVDSDDFSHFHIIFSTGCSPKQHWQSYLLFHSIVESGQTGHATRIASGCNHQQAEDIQAVFAKEIQPMAPDRFHLHLTPEFGIIQEKTATQKAIYFHYLNKPYGVAHWMEHALDYNLRTTPMVPEHDNTIVVLLDPDMVFLRPFVNDFSGREIWTTRTSYPIRTNIRHGFPMANEYAYGSNWYYKIMNANMIKTIIPPEELPSPAQQMTKAQINENYAAGPPYLATARDFFQIATKWRQLAVPVQKQFPDNILAEMFAYSWAAVHLNLPHQLAHSFMISSVHEQGFHLMDRAPETIHNNDNQEQPPFPATRMCRGIPTSSKPHILHYCQRYSIGKYIFGKHRLPVTFVGHGEETCQSPLLLEAPENLATLYDFTIDPDTHLRKNLTGGGGVFTKQEHINRMAFLFCEQAAALNRAALYYKQQHCQEGEYNTAKTMIFHDSLEVTEQERTNYE